MAEKPVRIAKTPEDKRTLRSIGRAIWRAETDSKATTEEKKAGWSEGRRKYLSRASKLLRGLEKEGLHVTPATTA